MAILLILPAFQLIGAESNQDSLVKEDNNLQVSLNTGFCDKYLWRGITFNKGPVFQPEVDINYKDFSFSSWGNFGLSKVDEVNFNEIDFILGYSHSFNSLNIDGSLSYYYYLNKDFTSTLELNAGISYPIGDFTPFIRSSYDLLACSGAMFCEIGFDYEKDISDKFTVFGTLLTGIGSKTFNEYYLSDFDYPEIGKSSFNLAGCNLGISYSPFEKFSVDADFTFNMNIDKEVRKTTLGNTSNLVEIVLRKEF
jgi:hypothetical protein